MPSIRMKFPVLKDVEYIDVTKDRKTLLTLNKLETEGLTWRQLQLLIGQKLGAGIFYYVLKFNNKHEIHKGGIKAVSDRIIQDVKPTEKISSLEHSIKTIADKVEKLSTGNGVSIDLLLDVTKQSYVSRIEFMTIELNKKENEIERNLSKIETLESDLYEAGNVIEDLKSKTGIMQYIEIGKEFLKMKSGNAAPITNLQDSNSTDIPPNIIEVLGVIDWNKVDPNVITEIVHYLKIFATKLPLKGQ